MDLNELKTRAQKEIRKAKNLKELDKIFKKYLGKKGEISRIFSSLKGLSEKEKKKLGKEANLVKREVEEMIKEKLKELQGKLRKQKIEKEKIDVTRPGKKLGVGHLHPLTLVQREVLEIFQSLGFSVVLGPEVETEWYNFDALNIPKDHPARDFWDTFWLLRNQKIPNHKSQIPNKFKIQNSKFQKLLLRTHTSPVQIRYMEKHSPPLRIVVPGKCFRHEATDASHEIQFYQLECLMVDENVSVANFKAIIEEFLKRFFKTKIEIRLRPSYFPFTEPSFEIDIRGEKKGNWTELLGAGMVHPNVFKAAGINPKNWQGFAFGVGLDRLAMLRYKINDIRLFYSGDLRFLKQF
ncbi:phenylalanine--tRNA ligase subunit alpha [bacterium]|nr:phenylalanine--tRNA ligase subunit alpha [bacterium]